MVRLLQQYDMDSFRILFLCVRCGLLIQSNPIWSFADDHHPGLGWLWFGCSTHLSQLPSHFCQIPISPGRIGRQWKTQNSSQPNPVHELMGRPVLKHARTLHATNSLKRAAAAAPTRCKLRTSCPAQLTQFFLCRWNFIGLRLCEVECFMLHLITVLSGYSDTLWYPVAGITKWFWVTIRRIS